MIAFLDGNKTFRLVGKLEKRLSMSVWDDLVVGSVNYQHRTFYVANSFQVGEWIEWQNSESCNDTWCGQKGSFEYEAPAWTRCRKFRCRSRTN